MTGRRRCTQSAVHCLAGPSLREVTKAWEDDEAGTLPKGIAARQFLQMVMRGEIEPEES